MPYTPVIKTTTQLLTDIDNQIKANGINAITGNMLGQLLSDITASLVNKVENINLLGLQNYDAGGRQYKGGVTGDCCIKDGMLMQCVTDTQGVFNSAHWKTIVGIEQLTRAQILSKIAASTLLPGVLYHITDRSIFVRSSKNNVLDSRCVRIYRVPRYEELNGDGLIITVWGRPEAASIVIDQHVAYQGSVYIRTSVTDNFNTPDVNTDYSVISPSSNLFKDYPVAINYDINDDQVTDARDQYGNIVIISKKILEDLSIADPFLDLIRWGDPLFCNNLILNALPLSITNAVAIKNCIMYPGSILNISQNSSRTAVFNQNVLSPGATLNPIEMYENTAISNSNFLAGADWSNKVLPPAKTINNFTCGIQWPDSTAIGPIELSDKTVTNAVNDLEAQLDVDLFVSNPSSGIGLLEILSVWWAGTIKLMSGSSATGIVINQITSYAGKWPYRFIAEAPEVARFESVATNPTHSQIYFASSDSENPFNGNGKGYIVVKKTAPGEWICETSKEI